MIIYKNYVIFLRINNNKVNKDLFTLKKSIESYTTSTKEEYKQKKKQYKLVNCLSWEF